MTRGRLSTQTEKLHQQAEAVREAAGNCSDDAVRLFSLAAAETLDALANKRPHPSEGAVLELAANASDAELREARARQAVRRGAEVFLPSWRDASVGLPNLLLRSELFRAANNQEESVAEAIIAVQGDTSITFTGIRLNDYDRRVFAACLNHYRCDCPLSAGGEVDLRWIRVSFYQLSKALGVTYGENVHKAIRASLIRLNAAHLRLRVKRRNVPMPRLLEAAFEERESDDKGNGVVAFRVLESMANLFGPTDWTAVSTVGLNEFSGLPAWLVSFYSTHKNAYPLQVSDLYRYSGVVCELREFRRRLKKALTQLMEPEVPESIRVKEFEMSGGLVTVRLERWKD